MYKVNYTFKVDEYTQMGSFEVSDCSFNENEFFTLVDFQGEKSLSVLYLNEPPEVYGKTIYLNVKNRGFPMARDEINYEVEVNRDLYFDETVNGDEQKFTITRYERAFDRLSIFRYEDSK